MKKSKPSPATRPDKYDEIADPAGIGWLLKEIRAEKSEAGAWDRLRSILDAARHDPQIVASRRCAFFTSAMGEVARKAANGDDPWKCIDAHLASVRAEARNAAARTWVRDQWAAQAAEYSHNKTAFAADYGTPDRANEGSERGLVWGKFKVRVTTRTIRERWLKGC
jgi:hypothetical protein